MELYQVDAFAENLFEGNPAAVCLLNEWISEETMQNIAAENNLAETAFLVQSDKGYEIRWFTPTTEVDLCGHATLASAHVLYFELNYQGDEIQFTSRNKGMLTVQKSKHGLTLNFPADKIKELELEPRFESVTNHIPNRVFQGSTDWMLIFETESEIRGIEVNEAKLLALGGRGLIVTARGMQSDFVSRFFAPQVGISEDPVTGSAHTTLTPFWAKELKKEKLTARQVSKRGGKLICELKNDRIEITGKTKLYLKGNINI